MTNVKNYQRPSTLEEAWMLLNAGGTSAMLVGGGVDVGLFAPPDIETLIDVTRLPHHDIVLDESGLSLGAAATLTDVMTSPPAHAYLRGILVATLRLVASPLLRNAATVGGSIASIHPWSDVLTLLLALDAQVRLFDGQARVVSLSDLLAKRGMARPMIIVGVTLPGCAEETYASYEKFVRTGFDVALLNCGCRIRATGTRIDEVRFTFGGTPDIAGRLTPVEQELAGKHLTDDVIETAARSAAQSIPARDDIRASGEYRRILAAAGVRRCLKRIAKDMEGAR